MTHTDPEMVRQMLVRKEALSGLLNLPEEVLAKVAKESGELQLQTAYQAGVQAERQRALGLIGNDEPVVLDAYDAPLTLVDEHRFYQNELRQQLREAIGGGK